MTEDLERVENWPQEAHKIGSVAYVHAFGQIALTSAMLKELIVMLLVQRLPMARVVAVPLVQKLTNRERNDWLRALVLTDERETEVAELYAHAVLCFEICIENRNKLLHALGGGMDEFTAKMKLPNERLREFKFQVSLAELRKVAVGMGETVNFLAELYDYLRRRKSVSATLPPLPKKPARPDRVRIPSYENETT